MSRAAERAKPFLQCWWLDRPDGTVTFWMAQLLSGDGCFGSFLWRIGKVDTGVCWHCQEHVDTADHAQSLLGLEEGAC